MNTHNDLCGCITMRQGVSDERARHQQPCRPDYKRVVVASMAGTVVEWYEFFLYATAATLVFSKVFFAEGDSDLNAIIAALRHLRASDSSPARSAASSSDTSATSTAARSCCSSASCSSAPRRS